MTVLLALVVAAHAGAAAKPAPAAAGCDPKPIQAELAAASPVAVPTVYVKLAQCSADAAKTAAPDAFKHILAGADADPAVTAAIGIGASDVVRTWITSLEPDQRTSTVSRLGGQCKTDPHVEQFFVDTQKTLGDAFWTDRWFKGLQDCRTTQIQTALGAEVGALTSSKTSDDKALFNALLEVYARNLQADALPTLTTLLTTVKDPEEAMFVVNAFADAADVGGANGTNPQTAVKAVEAIRANGAQLPPKAVDQARQTLLALGSEEAADQAAAWRWPERMASGKYRYAVAAVETVTCKNGKKQAYFHWSNMGEAGKQWPEEIQPLLNDKLTLEWNLHAADKCKGTEQVAIQMPTEPFTDDASQAAWVDAQRKAFKAQAEGMDLVKEVPHPAFDF